MRRPDYRMLTIAVGLTSLLLQACAQAPADRTRFATPDDAARALSKALETDSAEELKAIFGPDVEKDLTSGDPISDRNDRQTIALAMEQSWRWDQLYTELYGLEVTHTFGAPGTYVVDSDGRGRRGSDGQRHAHGRCQRIPGGKRPNP